MERKNGVWSYDFVEDRTHGGGKLRMLIGAQTVSTYGDVSEAGLG